MNLQECERLFEAAISRAFKEVMESGFLYISKKVDVSAIMGCTDGKNRPLWETRFTHRPWAPDSGLNALGQAARRVEREATQRRIEEFGEDSSQSENEFWFTPPPLTTWCAHCNKQTHHEYGNEVGAIFAVRIEKVGYATYILVYQCMQCKTAPLTFLVHRELLKLQLAGRSIAFFNKPPNDIPKNLRAIYSDAVQAAACNDIPAAFYHWRTFMEHLMKDALGIGVTDKIEGDGLSDRYNKTIDPTVASRASLTEVMRLCSQHLHARTGDAAELERVKQRVEQHFTLIATLKALA
jgi:Zn finger protein HypA/HybF involved in hydrogenase expression